MFARIFRFCEGRLAKFRVAFWLIVWISCSLLAFIKVKLNNCWPTIAGFTIIATWSGGLLKSSWSLTIRLKIYVPADKLLTVGLAWVLLLKIAVEGPLTWLQEKVTFVPFSGSEPEPVNITLETGRVMVLSDPALAVGAWLVFVAVCRNTAIPEIFALFTTLVKVIVNNPSFTWTFWALTTAAANVPP